MNQSPKYLDSTGVASLLEYINQTITNKVAGSKEDIMNILLTQEDLENFFTNNIERITNQELDAIFNS